MKLTGGAVVPAVLGMRLIALGALALTAWAVRGLGGGPGGRAGALWLAVLNPLFLIHVVGGTHNDGLMIGLVLAGVLLATRGRWVLGSVLVGCAVMVKSPAAVALLFIGIVVARRAGGGARGLAKGLVLPGAVAGAVAAGATVLAGTGFGWLRTQSVAGTIHTALSATSDLGLGLGLLLADDPDPVKDLVQKLGLAAALVLIAVLARRAWRGSSTRSSASASPWWPWSRSRRWSSPGTCCGGRPSSRRRPGTAGPGRSSRSSRRRSCTRRRPRGARPGTGSLAGAVAALGLLWARRDPWRAGAAEDADPVGAPTGGPASA